MKFGSANFIFLMCTEFYFLFVINNDIIRSMNSEQFNQRQINTFFVDRQFALDYII